MVSQNAVLRKSDKNLALWQPSLRHFQWKICLCSSEMCMHQQAAWNGKLLAAFLVSCCPSIPKEQGCFYLKRFFSSALSSSEKKKNAEVTYLFSQEGKITFKTFRMRAAPTTPTTMTSIKLKKMGKDRNQNLQSHFLKSSTHWHITYNQAGR